MAKLIEDIENNIEKDEIENAKKEEVIEILNDIKESVSKKKKTSIIKNALLGLKDFLISAGATITANIINSKINGFF